MDQEGQRNLVGKNPSVYKVKKIQKIQKFSKIQGFIEIIQMGY